jgi:hypothetical protein
MRGDVLKHTLPAHDGVVTIHIHYGGWGQLVVGVLQRHVRGCDRRRLEAVLLLDSDINHLLLLCLEGLIKACSNHRWD